MGKTKLVYIVSAGHSGSTLLDFLIGSIPGTYSTGELIYYPRQLYRNLNIKPEIDQRDMHCTCGKDFYHCDIWSKVTKEMEKRYGIDMANSPFDLKLDIFINHQWSDHRPSKPDPHYEFLRRSNYFSIIGGSNLIPNLTKRIFRKRISNYWNFIRIIGEMSDSQYVVDSTKDPLRFKMLHSYDPANTKLIILIREPFGVVSSGFNYGQKIDIEKNAKTWLRYYNNKVYHVIKSIKKLDFKIVWYEDLCSNPEETRKNIGGFLNIEPGEFVNHFETQKYHLIAGNPMRYKNDFSIKYDERWKSQISEEGFNKIKTYYDQLHSFYK